MAKRIAEQSNPLSIFWLKKQGLLPKSGRRACSIQWSMHGDPTGSIQFAINTETDRKYMSLSYRHTNRWTNETTDVDYDIPLVTTPCNLGGERFWFVCPLSRNGFSTCGRKTAVLYRAYVYFGCRRCNNIAYESQMQGGYFRMSSVTVEDAEKLESEIKRWYYRGRPTRKHQRLARMYERMENDFASILIRHDPGLFERLQNSRK